MRPEAEEAIWALVLRAFHLNSEGTPETIMTNNTAPTTVLPKPTWTWDRQHLALVAAYAYGAIQTGYPVVSAVFRHGTPSWTAIFGLFVLLSAAVGGFLKNPPNSVESAVDAGKIAVAQAPAILATRASHRPPSEMPKREPVLTGTLQDENDRKEGK